MGFLIDQRGNMGRQAPARLLLALAAIATPAAAHAAHAVIFSPSTDSSAFASTAGGPNGQFLSSTARVTDTNVVTLNAQPGGTASHDALSNVRSGVLVTQAGSAGQRQFTSRANASADLASGRLKASVLQTGDEFFLSPLGSARAQLADTLFFTNTSGSDAAITIRYSFDGSVIDTNGSSAIGGAAELQISCASGLCFNGQNSAIRFAGSGATAQDNINGYFDESGIDMFARNIFGDQNGLFANFDVWQQFPNGSGGVINGWMQASLLIPTGETSLGLLGRLNLDCRAGATCDFGNTG
jgi:hypothetical protein